MLLNIVISLLASFGLLMIGIKIYKILYIKFKTRRSRVNKIASVLANRFNKTFNELEEDSRIKFVALALMAITLEITFDFQIDDAIQEAEKVGRRSDII